MKAPDSEDQIKSLHELILQNCSEDDKKQQLIEAIENGADIDARDSDGRTPLYISIIREHLDLIPLLLSHGANPNCLDSKGNSALHLFCLASRLDWDYPGSQYEEVLAQVAQASLDLNTKNHEGLRPIDMAVKNYNKIAISVLIKAGVDPNTLRDGETLLWHACKICIVPPVKILLALGADQTLFRSVPPIRNVIQAENYGHCHTLINCETDPYLVSKRKHHKYPQKYDKARTKKFTTTFEMYVHIKSCCHYLSTHPERAFRSLQRALSINRDLAFTEFKNIFDDLEKNIALTPSEKAQLIQFFVLAEIDAETKFSDEQLEELFLLVYRLVRSNDYAEDDPDSQKQKQLLAQFGLTLAALNHNCGYLKRFLVPMLSAAANSPLKDKNGEEIEICTSVPLSEVVQHLDSQVVDELITILVANVLIARTMSHNPYDYLINVLKDLFQHDSVEDEVTPHSEAKPAPSSPFIFCANPMQPSVTSETPLHRLCQHFPWPEHQSRLLSVAELLITNGADVNAHDYQRLALARIETPLYVACDAAVRKGEISDFNNTLIVMLLNHGANSGLHWPYGDLPFEIAATYKLNKLQHTLIENEKDPYLKAIIDESGYSQSKNRSFYKRFKMAARIQSCCTHLISDTAQALVELRRGLSNHFECVNEVSRLLNDERPTLMLNMKEKQQLFRLLIAADIKMALKTSYTKGSNILVGQHQRLSKTLSDLVDNTQDSEKEQFKLLAATLSVLANGSRNGKLDQRNYGIKSDIISMLITIFSDAEIFSLSTGRPLSVLRRFINALNQCYPTEEDIFNDEKRMEMNAWITSGFLGSGRREFLKEQRREQASREIKNIEHKRVAA